MMAFEAFARWDVVVVPFPFVEQQKSKPRPVLVLSNQSFNEANKHLVCAMITTGGATRWADDFDLTDLDSPALPRPSLVRWKLFTLPIDLISKKIGSIGPEDRGALTLTLARVFLS